MTPKGVTCILSLASNLGKDSAPLDHTLFDLDLDPDLDLDLDLDLEHGAASHPKQFMTRKTAMVSIQFGQSLAAL
jgi:hypothetical protein